jgi:hypothetical protein
LLMGSLARPCGGVRSGATRDCRCSCP